MRSSEMASSDAQVSSNWRCCGLGTPMPPVSMASTPRRRIGAFNGSTRQALAGKVSVPLPAGSPRSKAHCATAMSAAAVEPTSICNRSNASAASKALLALNSAARKRVLMPATCSGSSAADRSCAMA